MYDSETLFNMGKYRVRVSGKHEAIYDYDSGKRYTYEDLDSRSDKLAWFLVNKMGLKKGDRIGFCATNAVAFFDAYYATYKTGIIITTYNCLLREKELFSLIDNEAPKVIFYSGEFAFTIYSLQDHGFEAEYICLDEPCDGDRYCYADIMNNEDYTQPTNPGLDFEDIQMLIHTGGTTGTPKAAMMSFRAIFYNALADVTGYQIGDSDVAILTLPLFHTAGWNVFTLPILMFGGRIVIMRGFNPGKVLSAIREERPTVGISVETMYKAMAMHPDFMDTDFSCYRFLVTGAAPTGRELLEIYWSRGVKMVNAYGMTEVGPNNMSHPAGNFTCTIEEVREKWNSCGITAPFNQVRFVDDEGNDVPKGERGELLFRSKLLFSGYWNNKAATDAVVENGWVHTGDMGYLDEDGYCYISGRKKNMFISGGENIFPQEIEDVIMLVPGVLEACIVGVPDPKWGEVGRVLIVRAPGVNVSREDIVCAVRAELSSIKVPRYVTFVDCVPKNAVGKRDLNQIKKQFGKPED